MKFLDKSFLINLKNRKDRYKHFSKNYLNFFKSSLHILQGVDGKNHKYSLKEIKSMSVADWNIFEKPAVQGCFLSHIAILKIIVEKRLKTCLVLEDDIHFIDFKNLKRDLKNVINNLPQDWEIIFLGHSVPSGHRIINCTTNYVGKVDKNHYTHFYMINQKGAKNLLKYFENKGMYRAIDHFYNDYLKSKNIFYASNKSLAIQNLNLK